MHWIVLVSPFWKYCIPTHSEWNFCFFFFHIKKTFQVLPTFNLAKIILSPQVDHSAFCLCAQVPHFVSLLTFCFSKSSKKKLSVQSIRRLHGSLFIRWMPKVSNLWSWAKPRVFTHTCLETSLPSQGHPQEWRACYQGRAWGALISTSGGCWLIGLIGNLSCEVQCQAGRVRPGGVHWALAAIVVSSAARSFPSPEVGRTGLRRHLRAAWGAGMAMFLLLSLVSWGITSVALSMWKHMEFPSNFWAGGNWGKAQCSRSKWQQQIQMMAATHPYNIHHVTVGRLAFL